MPRAKLGPPIEITSELRTALKAALRAKEKTSRWLADQLGVKPASLSQMLNGRTKTSRTPVYGIALYHSQKRFR